jgi:tetratricopeptide (TPR) repeat protein
LKLCYFLCFDQSVTLFRADSLLNEVRADQKQTRVLLKQAKTAIQTADFRDAEQALQQASELWPGIKELEEAGNNLARFREEYTKAMKSADTQYRGKDLNNALQSAQSAAETCPHSEEAIKLINTIKAAQAKANACVATARELKSAAEFEKARIQIAQARELWTSLEELEQLETEITVSEEGYREHLTQARSLLQTMMYEKASALCERALAFCPKSAEALELKQTIKRELTKKREIEKKQKQVVLFALNLAPILAIGILGGVLAVSANLVCGLITIGMSLIMGFIGIELEDESGFFEVLYAANFVNKPILSFFIIASFMLLIASLCGFFILPVLSIIIVALIMALVLIEWEIMSKILFYIAVVGIPIAAVIYGVIKLAQWMKKQLNVDIPIPVLTVIIIIAALLALGSMKNEK